MHLFHRLQSRLAPYPIRQVVGGQAQPHSFLVSSGWARSRLEKAPVDRDGRPLPWYTYPAIRFLQQRVRRHFRVLEFGAGNSTRWWAGYKCQVRAIEHDAAWIQRLRPLLPGDVVLEQRAVDSAAYPLADGGPYHVIVIDGRRRNECAENAAEALTDDGVIIWDNSDRSRYAEGRRRLYEKGFRSIDFWGVVPGNIKEISTTIFYRDANCLGI